MEVNTSDNVQNHISHDDDDDNVDDDDDDDDASNGKFLSTCMSVFTASLVGTSLHVSRIFLTFRGR